MSPTEFKMNEQSLPVPSDGDRNGQDCLQFITETPADSGSDFYNTPPVGILAKFEADKSENETNESHSPTLIPGLSLIHDRRNDSQTSNCNDSVAVQTNDSGLISKPSEVNNIPTISNVGRENQEAQTEHAQNLSNKDTTKVEQTGLQPPTGDPMNGQTEMQMDHRVDGTVQAPLPETDGEGAEEGNPEWEIDSSPYESSSDGSSSEDSNDEDEEDYPILSPEEQARILMQAEMGSDDEADGKGRSGGQARTANELPEEVLPIPEVVITPDMKIVLLGKVESIVENTVLIAGQVSGEYQVLESGSLLCLEDRTVVGVVSETLGRVEQPFYTVRYSSPAQIEERRLGQGQAIFYVESHSTFVFTQPLRGVKGSDASNFHDEEVGEDEIEFSDDEAEAEYRRKLKQKRQERKETRSDSSGLGKAKKGPPGPSKLSQTELNYDEEGGEDGYTPLARPKNLHELLSHQEASFGPSGQPIRSNHSRGERGRGRGSDRGRGARGRRQQHDCPARPETHLSASQPLPAEYQPEASHYSQQPYQMPHPPMFGMSAQYPYGLPQPQLMQLPFHQQPFQQVAQAPYFNPSFFAALQQQQQNHTPQQHGTGSQQMQNLRTDFDQVKAQLEFLRQFSNGNHGP